MNPTQQIKFQLDPTSTAARDKAVANFSSLSGINPSSAQELVEKAIVAAIRQSIEVLSGENQVPQSMSMARAEQLYYLTCELDRELSDDEITFVFRCTGTAAASIRRNMNATYAALIYDIRVRRMREESTFIGIDGQRLLQITTPDSSTFEVLLAELKRLGIGIISQTKSSHRVQVAFSSTDPQGESIRTKDALGLKQ